MKVLKENKKDFGYIPLRVTTQYSLLEGAMKVDELVKKAVKLNIPALGVTDRNNLFGALEFSEYLSNSGIQPIIGCNFGVYHQGQLGTVICYAKNESGYKNLIKISSEIFLNNNNETIDLRRILELNENLICLSGGCEGLINNLLKKEKKNWKKLLRTIKKLTKIVKKNDFFACSKQKSTHIARKGNRYL